MIKFSNFSFRYGNDPVYSLKQIDLAIRPGEFVLVSGPSGGGKSSFCRCLNGLIPHFYGGKITGDVMVSGRSVLRHATRELATVVGMTFQDPENQLTATDVEREIAFGMENMGFQERLMSKRLEESLDTIGISHLRHRTISELSGGEKQKVAIASVLALHPKVLVMDEPTSELDPKGAEDVLSVVQRLNDELGLTVILVEHRLERVVHLVDRVILLHSGEVIADGPPRDVLKENRPMEVGVGVPPLIRLANRLRAEGLPIDRVPLTVKEGREIFRGVLEGIVPANHKRETRAVPAGPAVLTIRDSWFAYPGETRNVLKGISLDFHQGELVAVMGRNASGKSTMLKLCNGILRPTRGTVTVSGVDTRKALISDMAHTVGMVFQNPDDHLFADTVEEEIGLTPKLFGWPPERIRQRVDSLLQRFELKRYRDRYPRYLSGGEKQRVALASAIAAGPRVLALDEPTRGMDYRLKTDLMRFLREYCREGNTVILVSHDVETVAEHADRVVLMSEGRIVLEGSRQEVLSEALLFSPQINRLVQAFSDRGIPRDILTVDEVIELLK